MHQNFLERGTAPSLIGRGKLPTPMPLNDSILAPAVLHRHLPSVTSQIRHCKGPTFWHSTRSHTSLNVTLNTLNKGYPVILNNIPYIFDDVMVDE